MKFWLRKLRFKLVFPFIALLPGRAGYFLATIIGTLDWWILNHKERLEVEREFNKIPIFDPVSSEGFSIRYCRMMARDMLDCYRMPKLNAGNAGEFFKVVGLEHLEAAEKKGKGVILLVSHYGRYFMLGPALRFLGHGFGVLTTVIDEKTAPDENWRGYLLRKLKNGFMFCGGEWITTADSPRRMYANLRAGNTLLIAFDGVESNSDEKLQFPFLGGELQIPTGSLRIAKGTGAALVFASAKECSTGLQFELHALPDNPEQALQVAVSLMERDIIEMPWHWWLWRALPRLWEKPQGNY